MPISGVSPLSYQMTNKTSTASASALDDAWAWLSGRGQEVMAGVYTGETIGLTACGLLGEAWAPEFDAGIDSDADTDTDTGTDTVTDSGTDSGPECVAQPPIVETAFTSGMLTGTDLTTLPGTLLLDRNWTVRWHADEGILPNVDVPAWTWEAPSGGISALVTDPITTEPAVHMDETTADDVLRYVQSSLGFDNNTGSAFQIRTRIVQALGTDGYGCAVELWDGTRKLRFGMDESRILETYTSEDSVMDTTTASHTYRLGLRFGGFDVYSDETFAFDQASGTIGFDSPNQIMWGDQTAAPGTNCEMYVNHFYYYDGGDMVPFLTPGSHESEIHDLGTSLNDLGSGATIVFNSTTPVSTSIAIETRSGDTATPDGSWSSWAALAGNSIQSGAARYLQIRAILSTSDPSISPQLDDYTANYCTF